MQWEHEISMFPTLLPGNKIETEKIAFEELCRGDIIVYNNPENIRLNIIHRIIGCDSEGLITRGDNNSQVDPYRVRPEHHPLRVVAAKRGSRRLTVSKYGMVLHRLRILQMRFRVFKAKFLYPGTKEWQISSVEIVCESSEIGREIITIRYSRNRKYNPCPVKYRKRN